MVRENGNDIGWMLYTPKDRHINYCPWCGADVRIKYEDLNMNMQELVCIGGPCHGIRMMVDVDDQRYIKAVVPTEDLTTFNTGQDTRNEVIQYTEYSVEVIKMKDGGSMYFLKYPALTDGDAFVLYLEEMLDET